MSAQRLVVEGLATYSVGRLPMQTWNGRIQVNSPGVGFSEFATRAYTFNAYDPDPNDATLLPTLGGQHSEAVAISDSGYVVGNSSMAGDRSLHAFEYDGIRITDLGTLGGSWSRATAVNKNGDVVGISALAGDRVQQPFLYHDGTMTAIGQRTDTDFTDPSEPWLFHPIAINDNGTVLGLYGVSTGQYGTGGLEGMFQDNKLTACGLDLPVNTSLWFESANGLNDRGQVVGNRQVVDQLQHMYLWENGVSTDLTPDAQHAVNAVGINSAGTIAGFLAGKDLLNGISGFVYDGSGLHELNDLLSVKDFGHWQIERVVSINDLGQIVATARDLDSTDPMNSTLVLLTPDGVSTPLPVPEPSTVCCFALGLAGLAAARLFGRRTAGR